MSNAEKRQHPRVFFSDDAGIIAYFEHKQGDGKPFPAFVMNMSAGGLGVSTHERLSGSVKQGDLLHLNYIKVKGSTSSIRGLPAKAQWVLEEPTNDKLVLGLEFYDVSTLMEGRLRQFLETAGK